MSARSEFGNWQLAMDNILEKIELTDTFRMFRQLQSNEERLKFIFQKKLLKHVQWLPLYFNTCNKWHHKSAEVAKVWKNKGNKLFQQKKYMDAVSAYSESCLHAPVDKGDDLSVSFGNRSAALFHQGLYRDCLTDIGRAMLHKFPTDSLHKLLARRTSALIKLGQKEEAEKSYLELKDFANSTGFKLEGNKKDDFLKEVDSMEKLIKDMHGIAQGKSVETILPAVSFGANSIVSQATDAVSFSFTAEKGRHLLASRPIPKGSTLIVERPFAAVLLPDHYETHCHHCFSPLPLAIIGCEVCTTVRFCSEVCHEAAWVTYHRIECPYMDLFHSIGIAHLSLRIILHATLDFLKDFLEHQSKFRKSTEPSEQGISQEELYDRSYLTVYDLMTHEESTESQDMLQYSLTAALLLVTLIHSGSFNTLASPGGNQSLIKFLLRSKQANAEVQCSPDMHSIGGLLLRHILQLVCNAHAITSLKATSDADSRSASKTQDTEQVRIATAIYPTVSLMNHSCDPTIISSFIGDVLVVRTVKDVAAGEEIYNCYGPHFCRMNRDKRQEVLKSQYHFECHCSACSGGDVSHARFGALKCPSCAGTLSGMSCLECGHHVDEQALTSLKFRAGQASTLFEQAVTLMNSQDYKGAIHALKECQSRRQEFLYKDHRDLAQGEDALARCYANLGDYSSSADHLCTSVKFAEKIYGDKSSEFAYELQKLAEVLFNAERFIECLAVANHCLGLFENLYTPGHDAVKQITELRDATQLALTPMMQAS